MFEEIRQINEAVHLQIGECIPDLRERISSTTCQIATQIQLPKQCADGRFAPIPRPIGGRNFVIEVKTVNITAVCTARIPPNRIVSDDGGKEVRPTLRPCDAWI